MPMDLLQFFQIETLEHPGQSVEIPDILFIGKRYSIGFKCFRKVPACTQNKNDQSVVLLPIPMFPELSDRLPYFFSGVVRGHLDCDPVMLIPEIDTWIIPFTNIQVDQAVSIHQVQQPADHVFHGDILITQLQPTIGLQLTFQKSQLICDFLLIFLRFAHICHPLTVATAYAQPVFYLHSITPTGKFQQITSSGNKKAPELPNDNPEAEITKRRTPETLRLQEFFGCGGRTRTYDLRVMRASFFVLYPSFSC